jgi:hypothetical protein
VALFVLPLQTANLPEGLTVSNAAASKNVALEILKSALVIPVVMAIVVGTGWGLVRLGAERQRGSSKPDPKPAEIASDGALTLEIPFAQVTGEIHYGGGSKPQLANWTRTDETVTWRFEVLKPGRYAVELDCASDAANAGSVVTVTVDAASLQITVPNTGGPKTFKTVRAGTVEFAAAGWRTLQITPTTIPHKSVMILRGVRLVPVTTSS